MRPSSSAGSLGRGASSNGCSSSSTSTGKPLFVPFQYKSLSIGEEIGKGRFKKVCRGTLRPPDERGDRDVVILRYARSTDRKELDILALLNRMPVAQQFVPQVYGSCEERPESLVVQERALFGSLKTAIAEGSEVRQAFSPAHRVFAASQVSRALAFLESVRIVHADVSCRNCLLFVLDEDDPMRTVVKVTDFGLAQLLPEGAREVINKQPQAVRWCAPETICHSKLSPRADAWSLGVTLWELLSGGLNPWCRREKRAHVALILRTMGEVGTGAGIEAAGEELRKAAPEAEPFVSLEDEFPLPEDCPQIVHALVLTCLRVPEDSSCGRPCRSTAAELAKAFDRFIERCLRAEESQEKPMQQNSVRLAMPLALKSRRLVNHSKSLANEASVQRIITSQALLEFADWAASRWDQLHEILSRDGVDPAGGAFPDAGYRHHGVTRERWAELLRLKGFKGEPNIVFDEIASEELGPTLAPRPRSNSVIVPGVDPVPPPEIVEISLAQFRRFEARVVAANASLSAADGGSVASRFARQLRQSRGTLLRAWRLDVDLHGTGRVAFADFTNACRKLGGNAQARLVWDCLRKEGRTTPLEFHELATEEAENLESFAQVLLGSHGFNLESAWKYFDDSRQNHLTLQDFEGAARRLGFDGDARLLFRGLDSGGLGRMLRDDFLYLGKVSSQNPFGRQATGGPLAELVMFMKREAADVDDFVSKLGVGPCQTEIAVNDLAARLTAVGFEGDALRVAARAARSSGGARVTMEAFRVLLAGEKGRDFNDTGSTIASLAPPAPTRVRPPPRYKEAWNNSVDDLSVKNLRKCYSARSFFDGKRKG